MTTNENSPLSTSTMLSDHEVEVKPGYKKTKIGWIPEEWNFLRSESVLSFYGGGAFKSADQTEDGIKWLKIANVGVGSLRWNEKSFLPLSHKKLYEKYLLEEGDVVMALTRPILDNKLKIGRVRKDDVALLNQRVAKLIPKSGIELNYAYYIVQMIYFVNQMNAAMAGTDPPNIGVGDLGRIKIPLPPLPEQRKIAQILSTWDVAIAQNQKLIEQLKLRKKGFSEDLLLGKKRIGKKENSFIRTKLGVEIPVDWQVLKVEDIFTERKEASNDINQYPLFSLTIEKGLTEKTAQYERSFLLKDKENNKYRLVYNDDILYNPMNLRFGAIAKADIKTPVSVSAYYNVIRPIDSNIIAEYFINLLKTYRYMHIYDRIAIGSLEEKKRVHLSMFFKLEVPFPPIEEQQAIAKVLTTADKEIALQEQQLAQLQAQKKGLMQQLLTGQKRVVV